MILTGKKSVKDFFNLTFKNFIFTTGNKSIPVGSKSIPVGNKSVTGCNPD